MPLFDNHPLLKEPFTGAQADRLNLPSLVPSLRERDYRQPLLAVHHAALNLAEPEIKPFETLNEERALKLSTGYGYSDGPKETAFESMFSYPLPEILITRAEQHLNHYKIKMEACKRLPTPKQVPEGVLTPEEIGQQLDSQLQQLTTLKTQIQPQGNFLAYPSHVLPQVDQWLLQAHNYCERVLIEGQTGSRWYQFGYFRWSPEETALHQRINEQVTQALLQVKAQRKALHCAIHTRLHTASVAFNPTLNATYSDLRHTVNECLKTAYESAEKVHRYYGPSLGALPKHSPWDTLPKADIDVSVFQALHTILHTSPYRNALPSDSPYWLGSNTNEAITTDSAQSNTGWRIPTPLKTLIPHTPRSPQFLFSSHAFAHQLPQKLGFHLALLNGLVHQMQATLAHPPIPLTHQPLTQLNQTQQVLKAVRNYLLPQQRVNFPGWRGLCRFFGDKRTLCIDTFLTLCNTLENNICAPTQVQWLSIKLQQLQQTPTKPDELTQTLINAQLKAIEPENPDTTQTAWHAFKLQWAQILKKKEETKSSAHPEGKKGSASASGYTPLPPLPPIKDRPSAKAQLSPALQALTGQVYETKTLIEEFQKSLEKSAQLRADSISKELKKKATQSETAGLQETNPQEKRLYDSPKNPNPCWRACLKPNTQDPFELMLYDFAQGRLPDSQPGTLSFKKVIRFYASLLRTPEHEHAHEKVVFQSFLSAVAEQLHRQLKPKAWQKKTETSLWNNTCVWVKKAAKLMAFHSTSDQTIEWQHRLTKTLLRYTKTKLAPEVQPAIRILLTHCITPLGDPEQQSYWNNYLKGQSATSFPLKQKTAYTLARFKGQAERTLAAWQLYFQSDETLSLGQRLHLAEVSEKGDLQHTTYAQLREHFSEEEQKLLDTHSKAQQGLEFRTWIRLYQKAMPHLPMHSQLDHIKKVEDFVKEHPLTNDLQQAISEQKPFIALHSCTH